MAVMLANVKLQLEFEKSHPVFEMLRLTAFLCLEESKAVRIGV